MTRIVLDEEMRSRLKDLKESLELCDESGVVLAYVSPLPIISSELAIPPITKDEAEAFRRNRSGRPLKDIKADLSRRQ